MKKLIVISLLFILSTSLLAQNSYLRNGTNGSGLSGEFATSETDYSQMFASAAFSISGILDLGLRFGNVDTTRFGDDATETFFGLVYNILPLKYSIFMFDLMTNVRGSYNYLIIESPYIESINGTMEGQGFSIAGEGILDFCPVDSIFLRAGYHVGYASNMINTRGDDGSPEGINITQRERDYTNGFLTGIWIDFPKYPIIGYEVLFLDSTNFGNYIKHRLSVVIKSN